MDLNGPQHKHQEFLLIYTRASVCTQATEGQQEAVNYGSLPTAT